MFVKTTDHLTPSLFSNYEKLNSTLKGYLDKNWCNIFYSQFFCKINEEHFKVLYYDVYTGANFPVNILVGPKVLKAIYDLSDEELKDLDWGEFKLNEKNLIEKCRDAANPKS